jgi:hypothetical protein
MIARSTYLKSSRSSRTWMTSSRLYVLRKPDKGDAVAKAIVRSTATESVWTERN